MSKRRVFEVKARCLYVISRTGRTCGAPTPGQMLCPEHQEARDRLEEKIGEPPFKEPVRRRDERSAL